MVSCSPDLSVEFAEQAQAQAPAWATETRKLSDSEGDNNKLGVAYPYTVYTAYDSTYSEDTKTRNYDQIPMSIYTYRGGDNIKKDSSKIQLKSVNSIYYTDLNSIGVHL